MEKRLSETDVLKDVTAKLESAGIPYMLTGSFAVGYYVQPRMTRDVDLVVAIKEDDISTLEKLFSGDYYISKQSIINAVKNASMFNIIHEQAVTKVDLIVRKNTEYRITEFERRKKVKFADFYVFIVSKEDLILSKMIWSKDTRSELQLRDIKNLMLTPYDEEYVDKWIKKLGLAK
ncbi:MAG: hypothetical protein V1647_00665 [Pseudomonadota bacterium]